MLYLKERGEEMPSSMLYIGSALLVLGFTFRVFQVTSRVTEVKKGKEKNLRNIGIIGVVAGFLIIVVTVCMLANERNALIVAGTNIIAVGVSTLLQYHLKHQHEKILSGATYTVIIVGFILCLAYAIVNAGLCP